MGWSPPELEVVEFEEDPAVVVTVAFAVLLGASVEADEVTKLIVGRIDIVRWRARSCLRLRWSDD